ncbi:uncharacterized protein MELLADRAFT_88500 [Melampsora larici-populina 98AG31]|uniref:Uncharacterized protein n=1 Tax=Melampsora larici-populina (strain 98AG31 / pathotype 3-4-7) TaxID=747676 RepID=F4RRY2_MELLP|nr:uncharacterized protein MELLADRAFT_88500 [Melampsora larici-populina 98AG31]EGG04758.1 hypothetical protein MELLADRAFT_88500 [Melampsora larici-populina 98AG31]
MATIGRSKFILEDYEQWQNLVNALEKSTNKKCTVAIKNDKVQVKAKEASATKKLITMTTGGGSGEQESEAAVKEQELRTLANEIFSKHAIEKSNGGPGKILTTPWDPTCQYKLTYHGAWIWAQGAVANIATTDIPPNTSEFRYEVKKNRWIHPDMGVDHRVQLRLQGKPQGAQGFDTADHPIQHGGSGSKKNPTYKHSSISHSSSMPNMKADMVKIGEKRVASNPGEMLDIKPDLKKIKVEPDFSNTINDPIYVSSEFKSDWQSESESRSISIKFELPSTAHSVELELFLSNCNIAFEDEKTRTLIKEAGFKSWTDFIPSLQLTESTLTSKGIDRQIANRLLTEAQARFSKLQNVSKKKEVFD